MKVLELERSVIEFLTLSLLKLVSSSVKCGFYIHSGLLRELKRRTVLG